MQPTRRQRILKRTRSAAIFLAAGMLLTIAIAWAAAMRLDPDRMHGLPARDVTEPGFRAAELAKLRLNQPQTASDDEIIIIDEHSFAVSRRTAFIDPYWHATTGFANSASVDATLTWFLVSRVQAGWPLPALGGRSTLPATNSAGSSGRYRDHGVVRLPLAGDAYGRALPLKPLWPGFVVNACAYSIALWLMFGGPRAIRCAWRRRRGLCPRCAYPRGASRICTECGEVLPPVGEQ